MSPILLSASSTLPTSAPAGEEPLPLTFFAILIGLTLASVVMCIAYLRRRPQAIAGPARWGAGEGAWPLAVLGVVVLGATFIAATACQPLTRQLPESTQTLILSIVGYGFAVVAVILANRLLRPSAHKRLGLCRESLPSGILQGAVGLVVILPWVMWSTLGIQWLINHLQIRTQSEHEIFRQWHSPESSPLLKLGFLFAAVVAAPLAEELFFRGIVQSLLSYLFSKTVPADDLPAADASAAAPLASAPASLTPAPATLASAPAPLAPSPAAPAHLPGIILPYYRAHRFVRLPTAHGAILSILLTSMLFGAVHQPWPIMPPVFILSLGLGWLYERTGNLWACVVLHLLFNASQFALFLTLNPR